MIRILKFDSEICAPCIMMNRKGALDAMAKEAGFELVTLTIADKHGDVPRGSRYDASYDLSDDYDVQSTPTLIAIADDGTELARCLDPIMSSKAADEFRNEILEAQEGLTVTRKAKTKIDEFIKQWKLTP